MLNLVVWRSCRHMSSTTFINLLTSLKTKNSYRITLSDPKTRYVVIYYRYTHTVHNNTYLLNTLDIS